MLVDDKKRGEKRWAVDDRSVFIDGSERGHGSAGRSDMKAAACLDTLSGKLWLSLSLPLLLLSLLLLPYGYLCA